MVIGISTKKGKYYNHRYMPQCSNIIIWGKKSDNKNPTNPINLNLDHCFLRGTLGKKIFHKFVGENWILTFIIGIWGIGVFLYKLYLWIIYAMKLIFCEFLFFMVVWGCLMNEE